MIFNVQYQYTGNTLKITTRDVPHAQLHRRYKMFVFSTYTKRSRVITENRLNLKNLQIDINIVASSKAGAAPEIILGGRAMIDLQKFKFL